MPRSIVDPVPSYQPETDAVFLDFPPHVQDLQKRLNDFMDVHVYPNQARYYEESERLGPWKVAAGHRGVEAACTRGRLVEPFPATFGAWRRPLQLRVRAALRDHGPQSPRARSI